ncbi:putative glucan endo-1,3-beta-glucosidase btgC [Leucoagaricus sp. SymC.cos]|nr:putative glucan endo-1,3-beta-glucosidase btgC [Leucoagaricus sp. SymC.cos]
MQPYRDNPFSDSHGNLNYETGAQAGHQYPSNEGISQGYPGIPLSGQGDYRNVAAQSQTDLGSNMGQRMSNSQWDSSRYNQGSTWLTEQGKQTKRSKIVVGSRFTGTTRCLKRRQVIAGVVALVIIITVSVAVGVTVGRRNSSNNSSSKPNTSAPNPDAVNQTDPNDPSTFVKDPNLHQAFYGIAYTPVGSQLPDCGNSLDAVIQDVQARLLSQITKRVRLYGADCNQTALVLEAIKRTKVDMTVWLGNYVVPDDNNAAYNRQKGVLQQAIQDYGSDHIGGMTVGNEFMLNYVTAHGGVDPNSPTANQGAQILISNIQDTQSWLQAMNLPKHIPIGNADAGSFFNNEVLQIVEYGMSNVHPWFANVSVQNAASWTTQFFQETNVNPANALPNKPQMYIAETGWPTKSSDAGNANNGASTASEANLQTFLDTFVCQSNSAGIGYFFFEFADEDWKDKQFGGVEGWWGLFNQNRTLKNLKIPTCTSP